MVITVLQKQALIVAACLLTLLIQEQRKGQTL